MDSCFIYYFYVNFLILLYVCCVFFFFFFQAEDGIRDLTVTGVQTCALPICARLTSTIGYERRHNKFLQFDDVEKFTDYALATAPPVPTYYPRMKKVNAEGQIGRASCRERV